MDFCARRRGLPIRSRSAEVLAGDRLAPRHRISRDGECGVGIGRDIAMELTPVCRSVTRAELIAVGSVLSVMAAVAPLPLYVSALAIFGLPHVLWEMNWIWRTYERSLPMLGVMTLFAILLLQAVARLGTWRGVVPANTTMVVDVMTLTLLTFAAAILMRQYEGRRKWLGIFLALAISAGLIVAVETDSVAGVLVLLAIAHNFTPLALMPPGQHLGGIRAGRALGLLFALPWLVAALVWAAGPVFSLADASSLVLGKAWLPPEAVWLQKSFQWSFAALLSGLVLSQCLHYYCVLRLLPATLQVFAPRNWLLWAVLVSTLLTVYFAFDFSSSRKLYSVAAGAHAWLEWPLILLLLGGMIRQPLTPKPTVGRLISQ